MAIAKNRSAGAKKPAAGGTPLGIQPDVRLSRLRELVKILEGSSLAELSYQDEEIAVSLSRQTAAAPVSFAMPSGTVSHLPTSSGAASSRAVGEPAEDPDVHLVKSPFVGTFYRSPRPGAPSFTDVGEKIRRGQTICIIEAMKLMNEIESEVDGTVVEILAENAKPVQYGDPLFKIKKG